MLRKIMLAAALLLPAAPVAYAADQPDPAPAVAAAQAWVQLIDQGNYADSWDHAAPAFQAAVTAAQWAQQLHIWREPLGKLQNRNLGVAKYYTQLPGVPDGHYWIVQMQSSFANKQSCVETITLTQVGNDWKATGYFIR
jgi:Protein of unknown function (DUF4019)